MPFDFKPTSADVRVWLDDDGAVIDVRLEQLSVVDVDNLSCQLNALIEMKVSFRDWVIGNLVEDGAFMLTTTSTATYILEDSEPNVAELMFDQGRPSIGAVADAETGTVKLTYDDAGHELGTQAFRFEEPVQLDVDFSLRGLTGTLDLDL